MKKLTIADVKSFEILSKEERKMVLGGEYGSSDCLPEETSVEGACIGFKFTCTGYKCTATGTVYSYGKTVPASTGVEDIKTKCPGGKGTLVNVQ